MNGNRSTWMFMEWSRCEDGKHAPAETWYRNERFRLATSLNLAHAATLYRNVAPQPPSGDPRYMALYESRRAPEALVDSAERKPKHSPAPLTVFANTVLQQCNPPTRLGFEVFGTAKTGRVPAFGLVAVRSLYPEGRWERPFNRWYNHHIQYVLERGVFHTGYRFRATAPGSDGQLLHWAFYETEIEDMASFMPRYIQEQRTREQATPGWYPDYVKVLGSIVFDVVR